MTHLLRCLTTSSELREAARTNTPSVALWLLDTDDTVADIEVTVRAVWSEPAGRDRLICVLPCGHFISLILPAATDAGAAVEIVDPQRVIDLINTADSDHPNWMVAAAEQYLRWLEPLMTRPVPVTADDSPYAHHPVLRTLSLGIRTHIADQLAVGRRIAAIKTVRDNVSGLALRDAKTFVDALEYWWHL